MMDSFSRAESLSTQRHDEASLFSVQQRKIYKRLIARERHFRTAALDGAASLPVTNLLCRKSVVGATILCDNNDEIMCMTTFAVSDVGRTT